MSLEAWGDEGDDHELPDGCWGPVTVECVVDCIKDLVAEQLYEDGQMAKGVSTRFLMRLTLLQCEAGLLEPDNPLVREAEAFFYPPKERARGCDGPQPGGGFDLLCPRFECHRDQKCHGAETVGKS